MLPELNPNPYTKPDLQEGKAACMRAEGDRVYGDGCVLVVVLNRSQLLQYLHPVLHHPV